MSKKGGLTFTALAILLVVVVSLSVVSQESGSKANVSGLNVSEVNSSDAVVSQANESLAGSEGAVSLNGETTAVVDGAVSGSSEENVSLVKIEPKPRAQNLVRKVVSDARIHEGVVAQVQSEGSASVIVLLSDVDSGRSASAQGVAVSRERAGRAKQAFRESLAGKGISDASVSIKQELYTVGAVAMTVDEAGLAILQENPFVARVLPNGKRSISRGTISDAGISLNESAPVINSDDVANLTVNGSNLTGHGEIICVIDTGIDTSHLLFGPVIEASNIVGGIFGGYDFVNNDANASDDNNHGTHVSGIAVGNFSPYFGVARNAQVVPVKVCDAAGSCPDFAILAGVDYCNNNISGVTVISGSLGGGAPLNSSTCSGDPLFASLELVLNESLNKGIIPVFASGNNGCGAGCTTGVDYPACSPQVISVGSTTKADAISTFTDRGGDRFDIYAPGQSITSSIPTFNVIQAMSGTSQATPHVSGVIAVLQQNERLQGRARLNLTTIRRLLQETGVPIPPNDSRVDVLHAIARLNANFSLNQTANLVRDVVSNSSIQFYSASDLGQVLGCVELRENFAGVNSTDCPQYNKSAHVVLGGVTNPAQPYVDGAPCPLTVCQNVTLTSKGLEMDVTGFSNFTSVPGCGIMINESASLNQSINATATCITFGADNIELDCNGFTIGYANESFGYGINATGRKNITIRNCVVNQSSPINNAHAIFLSRTNNSVITNVSLNVTQSPGQAVYIEGSEEVVVGQSRFWSAAQGNGVYVTGSENVTVRDNNFISAGQAIGFDSSVRLVVVNNSASIIGNSIALAAGGLNQGSLIENNSISGNQNRALFFSGGNAVARNNVFVSQSLGDTVELNEVDGNVTLENNVIYAQGTGQALYLRNANSSRFVNNTVRGSGGGALLIIDGALNVFENSIFATDSGTATVYFATLAGSVVNNTFTNITLESNGSYIRSDAAGAGNNFTATRFFNASAGSLLIPNFTLPASGTIGQENLSIRTNFTFVNASALSFLNASAQIMFDNLPFVNPLPLVDENDTGVFLPCDSSRCTVISSGAGIIVFNVTGFTSYAASEGGLVMIVKEDGSDPVKAGALLNYTLTINSTQGNQLNATVTEFYPAEVSFVSSSPAPTSGNNTFSLGTLVEGVAITINITVRVGYTVANGTVLNNTANVSFVNSSGTNFFAVVSEFTTVLNEFANVSVTKEDVSDPVSRGGTLNYTVLLVNKGNVNASNITVVESYPENVSFVSSTPAPTSGNNTFVIAELAPNENTTVNITLAVGAGIGNGSVLNNSVLVTYVNQSGDNATALATAQTTVLGAANVTIAKSGVPDPVLQGEQLSYQLVVNNTGDDVAVNVTITETYPPNVSVVTSSPLPDAGNNTFIIGNLSPGQTATVNITLFVGPAVMNGTVLNNSANASWQNRTGDADSVIASELTTVIGRANISTNKTANESFVIRGNTVNFTISINNSGDDTAFNLTVTEIYPVQGSFVSASPAPSAGNATFFLGDLEPNGSVVVEISLNLTGANGTQAQNSYNVTFQRRNGSTVNLTNASSVTLLGFPVVAVAKTDSADPTSAGATLKYAVTVTNDGDDIAYNVTVVEMYPFNVTLNGTEPNATSGNDTFVIGNLLPGQSFTINISVNVSSAMVLGSLNNSVNATFANASGVNLTQVASQITAVNPPAAPFVQGGGGGGGGGASGVSTTQSMTGSSWSSAYLRAGDKVKFTANDAIEHTMTVLMVLTDRVTIRVASIPQEFTIKKGVVQAVDVTGDGKDDVRISVVDIAYGKALFHLEKVAFSPAVVRDAVPAPVPSPAPAVGQKEEPPLVQPAPQEQEEFTAVVPQGESEGSGGIGTWVVSTIVVLAIAGVLVAAVLLRKPKEPDALASAQEIEVAFRDVKSSMKESMQLVRKAERSERKK